MVPTNIVEPAEEINALEEFSFGEDTPMVDKTTESVTEETSTGPTEESAEYERDIDAADD